MRMFCPCSRNGKQCRALITGVPLSGWSKCQTCEMRFRMYMFADPKVQDRLLATWQGKNLMADIHEVMRRHKSPAKHPEQMAVG